MLISKQISPLFCHLDTIKKFYYMSLTSEKILFYIKGVTSFI